MKVKFYRGPMNGKTAWVRDDMEHVNVVLNRFHNFLASMKVYDNITPIENTTLEYTTYHRTNHTHPDGSVFFEWSQRKGTKI